MSLKFEANIGWCSENKWALCIVNDYWRQHCQKGLHNLQEPLLKKQESAVKGIKACSILWLLPQPAMVLYIGYLISPSLRDVHIVKADLWAFHPMHVSTGELSSPSRLLSEQRSVHQLVNLSPASLFPQTHCPHSQSQTDRWPQGRWNPYSSRCLDGAGLAEVPDVAPGWGQPLQRPLLRPAGFLLQAHTLAARRWGQQHLLSTTMAEEARKGLGHRR